MPTTKLRETVQPWILTHNMIYIDTKVSKITVVDIDDMSKCRVLTRLCCTYSKYHVKTKKGYHFYFNRCEELGNKLESENLGFDLPALVFAPPGFYDTDNERIEYKFTIATCYGFDTDDAPLGGVNSRDMNEDDEIKLVDMPIEIINYIKQRIIKDKKVPIDKNKANVPCSSKSVPTNNNSFQKYREFLLLIQDRNQTYEDWRNVGFALHQVSDSDEMYQVFQEWSQVNYPNYDDTSTDNLWQHSKDNRVNGITFGTLVHWAKEVDPEGYKQWNNKWGLGKLKYLVINFDQAEAAKYFHNCNKNKCVYKESDGWYMLQDNGRWKVSKDAVGFINTINDFLKSELYKLRNHYLGKLNVINRALADENASNEDEKVLGAKNKFCNAQIIVIKEICKSKIGSVNFRKGMLEDLKGLYHNEKIQFDNIWYYLSFNDGVYNLKTGDFREHQPEDYITKSVRYNYSDIKTADTTTLTTLINQILPDAETRKCWFSVICTALEGRTLERFNVFNGGGRNGKGLLDEILLLALGWQKDGEYEGYATTLSSAILCAPIINDSPKPEIAKLNKMRLIISSEAPSGSMFNNTVIKQLTGGSYISGRFCHSNKTAVNLQCTLISECNDPPPFREKVTDAEIERLIDILFPCKFTENEEDIDEDNNVFRGNRSYKAEEFQNVQKYAMMKLLLDKYAERKGEIYLPDCVRIRSLHYATLSHWALKQFDQTYALLEQPGLHVCVSVQNIFEELKESDIYNNLTRTEKRAFTKKSLIELFSKSPLYKKYYRERYQASVEERRINARNVLVGFVKLDEDGNPIINPDRDIDDPTI